MDPEALERRLDRLEHPRHRVAVPLGELVDVVAVVAVLGDGSSPRRRASTEARKRSIWAPASL